MAKKKLEFEVDLNLNKTTLNNLKASLKEIKAITETSFKAQHPELKANEATQQLAKIRNTASEVETAITKAFNPKIDYINFATFNKHLKTVDLTLDDIYKDFQQAGAIGQTAFKNVSVAAMTADKTITHTTTILDKMGETLGNSIKWNLASSVVNRFTGSVERAYGYVKNLDTSLNDIRIVTKKSASDMEHFSKMANNAAQSLGGTTLDYTKSALIYYQQGLTEEEVQARSAVTVKAANVTGQSAQEVSEQLTAVWNGYKVSAEEAELYVDKLAAVAATTASDLEELSTGMSKVASAAAAMGVDVDQLSGMLSTIISVTRQAPESAGTALKTIFARIEDLKLDGEDAYGVTLGDVSSDLASMGIQILDSQHNLRDLGEVIEEIGEKWNSGIWSEGEKQALAISLAGKRQYNNLIALFDGWEEYTKAVNIAETAQGSLQEQQDIYMDSVEAHLNASQTAAEDFYDALLDEDSIKFFADLNKIVSEIGTNLIKSIGGGQNALLELGSIAATVFKQQIGQNAAKFAYNIQQHQKEKDYKKILANDQSSDKEKQDAQYYKDQLDFDKASRYLNEKDLQRGREIMQREADSYAKQQSYNEIEEQAKKQFQDFYLNAFTNKEDTNNAPWQELSLDDLMQKIGKDDTFDRELETRLEAFESNLSLVEDSFLDSLDQTLEKWDKQSSIQKHKNGKVKIASRQNILQALRNEKFIVDDNTQEKSKIDQLGQFNVSADYAGELSTLLTQLQDSTLDDESFKQKIQKFKSTYLQAIQDLHKAKIDVFNFMDIREDKDQNAIQLKQYQQEWEDFMSSPAVAEAAECFSGIAGGVGQVVSGFKSLSNMSHILEDDSLSAQDKVVQLTESAINMTGMITSGLINVVQSLPLLSSALSTLKTGILGLIGAHPALKGISLAIIAIGIVATLAAKAFTKNQQAIEKVDQEIQKLTINYDTLKNKANQLNQSIADYHKSKEIFKNLNKDAKEYASTLEDANQKARNLIETYHLFNEGTDYTVDNGLIQISEERLAQVQQEAQNRLANAESLLAISKIDRNNKIYTKEIEDFSRESFSQQVKSDTEPGIVKNVISYYSAEEINAIVQAIANLDNIGTGYDSLEAIDTYTKSHNLYDFNGQLGRIETVLTHSDHAIFNLVDLVKEQNSENNYYRKQVISDNIKQNNLASNAPAEKRADIIDTTASIINNKINNDPIAQQKFDDINKKQFSRYDVNQYRSKENKLNSDEDVYRAFAREVKGIDTAGLYYNGNNLVDSEGNKALGEDISIDQMLQALGRSAATEELLNGYSDDETKIIDTLNKKVPELDALGSQYGIQNFSTVLLDNIKKGNSLENFDFSTILKDLSPELKEKFINDLKKDNNLLNLDNNLLSLLHINSTSGSASSVNSILASQLQQSDNSAWAESIITQMTDAQDKVDTVFSDIISGKLTEATAAQNEEYQALIKSSQELAKTYPKLIGAAQIFADTGLIGGEAWLESLDLIEDKINQVKIQGLEEKLNTALNDLNNSNNKKNIQQELQDIFNASYQIQIELEIQADKEFNQLEQIADNLNKKLSSIGENFIVDGSQARELADTFPGILNNYTQLADGTIQLNRQAVQEATAAAKEQINRQKEATQAAIQHKIDRKKVEMAIYQDLLDRLKNSTDAEDRAAIISSTIEDLKMAKLQQDAVVEDATNKQTAKNYLDNWNEAYQLRLKNAKDMQDKLVILENGGTVGEWKPVTFQGVSDSVLTAGEEAGQALKGEIDDLEEWLADPENYADFIKELQDQLSEGEKFLQKAEEEKKAAEIEAANRIAAIDNRAQGKGSIDKKSKKEANFIDKLDEELDVYHKINLEIQDLDRNLQRLQKSQDTLIGKSLLDNLNQQLDALNAQQEKYAEKMAIAQREASKYQSTIAKYGASFDSNGQIANYDSLVQEQLNKVNQVIDHYNKLSASAQTENEKRKVEQAKKNYEKFKDELEKYEDTINNIIPELEDQITESLYKEIEIQITKFDMKLQLHLDMGEAEREWNEFKRKVIDKLADDDLLGLAHSQHDDILSYYNTAGTGKGGIQARTDHVNKILNDLQLMDNGGHSDIYSAYNEATGQWVDNKAKALEDLKTAYRGLMDDLTNVQELEDQLHDTFLDSIDAVGAAFDKQKESFEFLGSQIEHDIKLMQLLYGENAYGQMEQYFDKQLENTKQELAAQQEVSKYWKEKMANERQAVLNGTGDKEALEKYEENWKKAVADVNSLLEAWADQTIAKYENVIDKTMQALNNKISNGLGLDYVNEELDLLNKNAENYLDDINAEFAKQELANKWQDAINDTDSISVQSELNALMQEQLDMLEKKGKLTQYDIDRAEKEYEIALKQMALKEAQQNKSQMRLKRDANGNYSYQFVSDEDSIRDAQQELAQAQNDLYNFDKKAYQDNLDEVYAVWDEFQQKVAEAYKKYANDQDALNEHVTLLQEQYGEKLNFLTGQNLNIRTNLLHSAIDEFARLYDLETKNFITMTEAERDAFISELVPQWKSGVQDMINQFTGEGGFDEVCKNTFNKLQDAANQYQKDMEEIRKQNQAASDEALEQGQHVLDQSHELIQAADDEYERIRKVLDQVRELQHAYEDAKRAAIEASKAAYDYVQNSSKLNPEDDTGPSNNSNNNNNHNNDSNNNNNNLNGNNDNQKPHGPGGSGSIGVGDTVTFLGGTYYSSSTGGRPIGSKYSGQEVKITAYQKNREYPYHMALPSIPGKRGWIGWVKAHQLSQFDTGGYTGDWDDSTGRLALLHQKELVLNKNDTQNMLDTVNLVHKIIDTVGSNVLKNTSTLLSNLDRPSIIQEGSNETFEQQVYIDAKFEGQTSADQIQSALNNLVNVASQRANRHIK